MARKAKKKEDAQSVAIDEINEMEETIKKLESKLEKMEKKKGVLPELNKNNEKPDEENSDSSSNPTNNSFNKSDPLLEYIRDDNASKDDGASSGSSIRVVDKDENPLSNQTYEINPDEKNDYMIQLYLLYPITSGEIMVQIDAYLNVYQVQENRKLIQECESKIMKTNEPQPLQISVTTKEEPNKEKTVTFSKVIGIIHSLPMITSITTI